MKFLSMSVLFTCASMSYATPVEHMKKTDSLTNPTVSSIAERGLETMSDEELSQTQGQALMNLTTTKSTDQGLDFYRLGMEAQIDINANIKKLQLGCGGSKGSGACDLDIDNVSLTGITTSNAQGAGATTDFQLTNPFIEFAVSGNGKASTREISGFRLGAIQALGMMSLGGNEDTSTLSDDFGVNYFSGDIGANVTRSKISGVSIVGDVTGASYGSINANILKYEKTLIFDRATQLTLEGLEALTTSIKIKDPIFGVTLLDLPLGLHLNANLNNVPFKTIHALQVSDINGNPTSGAYLSLQSKDIKWQNIAKSTNTQVVWNDVAAKKGWWLSIPQATFDSLDVDGSQVKIPISQAAGGIFGQTIQFPAIDMGQRPVNNCYGSLTFC